MSSAILYVAIVVIWAAVLIPRWLRRDSAAPASGSVLALEAEGQVTADLADEEQSSSVRRRRPGVRLSRRYPGAGPRNRPGNGGPGRARTETRATKVTFPMTGLTAGRCPRGGVSCSC